MIDTRTKLRLLFAVAASVALASGVRADDTRVEEEGPDLFAALVQGEVKFALRYRVESVEDEAFAEDALASTLRSRLTYRTVGWRRWSAVFEVDDVHAIGSEDYNSTRNGETGFPTVGDPEGTEINQALLQYAGTDFAAVLGRQRLNLDDQRFVGASAWRQNEQTFDAVTLRARLPRTDIAYSYAGNVNRTSGPDGGTPPGDLHGDVHLLNVKADIGVLGSVTGFGYLLDFENSPAQSSQTFGARWTGNHGLGESLRLLHAFSFAQQQDAGDNPTDQQTQYWQLEAGLKLKSWSLVAGRESLSGNDTLPDRAFQTPLATLHIFQGWVNKFTTTPPQGVEDTYATLAGTHGNFRVQLTWHDFVAQAVDTDYGTEWNAALWWQIKKRYELLLKAGDYSSDGFSTDTTKLWVQFLATF